MMYVYDKMTAQNDFSKNGIRTLYPASCTNTEELNGDWILDMSYLITDLDDAWMYLTEWNIIKNNTGQLFAIFYSNPQMQADGKCYMIVKARHIFYYFNDKSVHNAVITGGNASAALSAIISNMRVRHEEGMVDYTFGFSSDITNVSKSVAYDGMSVTYALLGATDSVVNTYGGELYRDNFYFSINHRKEYAQNNAFEIRHGVNMIEVSETVDVSEMVTDVYGIDNYGNQFELSYVPNGTFPHHIIKSLKFSYSGESKLSDDVGAYFSEYYTPKIAYTVKFEDLKDTDKHGEWAVLQRFNVGDTGLIYSEKMGIDTAQKIISKTYNELTGKTENITLGNFLPSLIRSNRYSRMIATDDAANRRLDRLEAVANAPV